MCFARCALILFSLVFCIGAAPVRSRIAVVKAEVAVPASERAYAASLADGTARILARNGVKADLVSDAYLDTALAGRDLAFLVTCTKPTPTQVAALARFRGRGGKIRPLYSASQQVVSVAGTQPALKVRDSEDAKERHLLHVVGASVPGAWDRKSWERKRKVMLAAASTLGRSQRPRPGEIHAVWEHSGLGLYPGDWPRTFRVLRANGITDLFVNVSGAGFAHYASSVLPRSKEYARYGDQLAACLAAARGTGIRVHAWVICFNATRADPAYMLAFQKKGWRLKNKQGTLTEYLDPSNPDLRWRMLKSIDELARAYPVRREAGWRGAERHDVRGIGAQAPARGAPRRMAHGGGAGGPSIVPRLGGTGLAGVDRRWACGLRRADELCRKTLALRGSCCKARGPKNACAPRDRRHWRDGERVEAFGRAGG